MKQYILASASPRRSEILRNLRIPFEVVASDADELSTLTDPALLVEELSVRKGEAVHSLLKSSGRFSPDTVILSSDTVVSAGGQILGKPRDEEDARRMLRLLSGTTHQVVSGISLIGSDRSAVSHAVTSVEFAPLSEQDICFYLRSGEPFGKAGSYAIQGLASRWIRAIHGCYFNVVGLPVNRMCELYFSLFHEPFGM